MLGLGFNCAKIKESKHAKLRSKPRLPIFQNKGTEIEKKKGKPKSQFSQLKINIIYNYKYINYI